MTNSKIEYYSVVRPCFGQRVSGDAIFTKETERGLLIVVIDVLGHGEEAHELAAQITDYLETNYVDDIDKLIRLMHIYLKESRGAAAGLCFLNFETRKVSYVGAGNTVIRKFGSADASLMSQEGTLGLVVRNPIVSNMSISTEDVLLLYTDGITSHFRKEDYPRLVNDDVRKISNNIVRNFGKEYDDASCIALRYR
ncbi:MAG: stage II sporulation protein E (SpoIIE) [SAR86 cluster bacterium]|uniref:Stage II sporulation protein E (SpoIIE) n=1 Tax=SAR86 cluster bacterium TaxID=2030880 RepID=A0A2A4XE57_9GAMM|nr:MAG: stage II sporulation protein E (SpoIIE) [SAR86 cluster bacterium]